jgi:hypothetical protein
VDSKKLTVEAETELRNLEITVKPYESIQESLADLVPVLEKHKEQMLLPKNSSYAILRIIQEVRRF